MSTASRAYDHSTERFRGARSSIVRVQARLKRMAAEISGLLDSDDGHTILMTQVITDQPLSGQKQIAYLDMRRVNNGTLGLELSQARTVQVHGQDCSKTCLQITNVLMDSDGTSSPAMAAGLKKGDIIIKCGQQEAKSIKTLINSVREAQQANMKFLVLEYCRLSRFGFLQRDLESARADIEERCYQVRDRCACFQHACLEQHSYALAATGRIEVDARGMRGPRRTAKPQSSRIVRAISVPILSKCWVREVVSTCIGWRHTHRVIILSPIVGCPLFCVYRAIIDDPSNGLYWSGRIVQTLPVATTANFLRFPGNSEPMDPSPKSSPRSPTRGGATPRSTRNSATHRSGRGGSFRRP